jgi:CBS domain-containing protein
MQIKEIMSKDVAFVTPEATIDEVAQKMRDSDAGAILVGSQDKFVGLITDHDIATKVIADGKEPQSVKADAIMSQPVLYCFEDQDAEEVVDNMIKEHALRMLVVTRDKRATGVVAHSDFADAVIEGNNYTDTLAQKVIQLASKKAA